MSSEPTPDPGLDPAEAAARLGRIGPNELQKEEGTSRVRLLLRQFQSVLVALLVVASLVALAAGETIDAVAILTIVALNGLIGFYQEYRAERAVLALRAMTAPRARVRRGGLVIQIPAAEVVPGDLLVLEAGDLVAADARLRIARQLSTQEAALTGESLPVDKDPCPLPETTALAERRDRVWAGTAVATGTGLAEVVATGMATELGRIARLLARVQSEDTPLQLRLAEVGNTLLKLSVVVVALVAALGLAGGAPPLEVLMSAVSLAVAAVPEGLPAVVTIALALGVQRLAKRNVLIRKLPSVETLGSATVICTDKTGTLTTGVMTVRELWGPDTRRMLYAATACCDAELATRTGDPTELAILEAAASEGLDRVALERNNPRMTERPFDAVRKRMSVGRADGVLYVKGALDLLLPLCSSIPDGVELAMAAMAARGQRVLGVAVGDAAGDEENLALLGVIGMADPPRPEAVAAVAQARRAGITTVMITGDHPVTAAAIARELGIVLEGEDVAERVIARATPEQKVQVVLSWKNRGAIVAMTGDGVNDAPALREAHIGVAMGRGGTEVTREAADMVLTDDNFATIVQGVGEGRGIFDNIRKTLVYLLVGNTAELLIMLGAALLLLPVPLVPVQLLWINLITDGLPALALVVDPPDPRVLERAPRRPDEPMLGRPEWGFILYSGLIEAAVVLGMYAWTHAELGVERARSLTFFTLVGSELFRAFAARSRDQVLWQVGAFSNLRLLVVVAFSLVIQVVIHEWAWTQPLFRVESLSGWWPFALGAALVPVTVVECTKLARALLRRRR